MTEREKRAKSIENAKKKYPDITDENQLKELADKLEKKNRFIKISAMILSLDIPILAICFLKGINSTASCFGGLFVLISGLMVFIPFLKRKKDTFTDNSQKTIISMEYLITKNRKRHAVAIIIQFLILGISLLTFIIGDTRDDAFGFLGIFNLLICMPLYWIPEIKKTRFRQRVLRNEGFKLLKTKLYDKLIESGSETSSYYLIFEKKNRVNYNYRKEAEGKEFRRELDSECYLLLLYNEKAPDYDSDYKVDSVFWLDETIIAPELEKFIEE